MSDSEFVYFFHHIPKCGGTSMKAAFGSWFRRCRDYRPAWAEGRRLERFAEKPLNLEKLKPGAIVCGHFEVPSIHLRERYPQVLREPRYRLITFVREPFQLRLSLIRHELDHGRLTGKEPIERLLFERQNWLCDRFPCTQDDMEDVIDRYFYVGITEHSQSCFDQLAAILGKRPIHLPRKNRTQKRDFPITDEMRHRFKEVHSLDYALYDLCLKRWKSHILKTGEGDHLIQSKAATPFVVIMPDRTLPLGGHVQPNGMTAPTEIPCAFGRVA